MERKSSKEVFNEKLDDMVREYLSAPEESVTRDRLREEVSAHVMPYVKKIAHGLARRASDPVEDLIQVGMLGLLKALDRYNPLAGSSFKTYCTYFITGEIRHYIRDKASMIKAPRQMYELYYRINQIVHQLTQELGRPPSDEEIAQWLECPVYKVEQAQAVERRRNLVSLDEFLVGENGSETVHIERLVDDKYNNMTAMREDRMLLEQALDGLKEELLDVVRMTYYEDMSQTEIAKRLGISQMQVSRRLRKALDQLSQVLQPVVNEV